ncbi:MAG: hypothetical protein ACR5LG_01585 [Sodalis sp. (in: enterobacteria)]|uniref:hypothetical protein n=1 Tax=Sodalis sp. (in: enterobacteria) TaxID=1898979 RepID=UPI003F37BBBB
MAIWRFTITAITLCFAIRARVLNCRSEQYNATLSLARYGSLDAAYVAIRGAQGERTQLWNLSWSKSLWGDASLFVSGSYTPYRRGMERGAGCYRAV